MHSLLILFSEKRILGKQLFTDSVYSGQLRCGHHLACPTSSKKSSEKIFSLKSQHTMDLFRTPGASLEGPDRKSFGRVKVVFDCISGSFSLPLHARTFVFSDEIKELIDSATNDFLVRADWNANMACVDKMNSIRSTAL